jgi:glycosyltransferase involved in cell wall biosynthesis
VSGEPHVVSCIVPVYNGERYLAEALESILGQTYRSLEVIVVDDGSTDGTAAVLATYRQRITCLHQTNAGHAAARNRGLAVARGEFVAFLDADDLWHPEKLARQMARFQARPELDASVTHVQNFWMAELGAGLPIFGISAAAGRCLATVRSPCWRAAACSAGSVPSTLRSAMELTRTGSCGRRSRGRWWSCCRRSWSTAAYMRRISAAVA